MLNWFTGSSQSAAEPLTPATKAKVQAYDDGPETPAPVFAMRAFRHALFGTPKPEETDEMRANMLRRRTLPATATLTDDNAKAAAQPAHSKTIGHEQSDADLLSPSKRPGILLTPGTERSRRKSVAFEGNEKAESKTSPTPKDLPGKYPSPWLRDGLSKKDRTQQAKVARSTKTNQTKPAADQSNSQNDVPVEAHENHADMTIDMDHPQSASGRYWKDEFDSFSSKSTLELRKLAKKEQLAKRYAKGKDEEVIQLAETLKREQRKVAKLEEQLASQAGTQPPSALEHPVGTTADLRQGRSRETKHLSSTGGHKNQQRSTSASPSPEKNDGKEIHTLRLTLQRTQNELDRANSRIATFKKTNAELETSLQHIRAELDASTKASAAEIDRLKRENETLQSKQGMQPRTRSRGRSEQPKAELGSDIWADAADGSVQEDVEAGKPATVATMPLSEKNPNLRKEQSDIDPAKKARLEAAKGRLQIRRQEREKAKTSER